MTEMATPLSLTSQVVVATAESTVEISTAGVPSTSSFPFSSGNDMSSFPTTSTMTSSSQGMDTSLYTGTTKITNIATNGPTVTNARTAVGHPSTVENRNDTTTTDGSNITSNFETTELPELSTSWKEVGNSTNAKGLSSAQSTPSVKFCPEPFAIKGGKLLTTGPYIANAGNAVYSCLAGFMLTGQAKIGCNGTGEWDARPPKCVAVDNRPDVHNNISLDDSTRVPLWLTIILCITFGLVCLLLLACLLMYCLKIFGCLKGSAVGAKGVMNVRQVESGGSGANMIMVDDFGSKERYVRSKRASYEETDEGFTPRRKQHKPNIDPIPRFQDDAKRTYRREAKMPANRTWMPHSHNKRHINTSTK